MKNSDAQATPDRRPRLAPVGHLAALVAAALVLGACSKSFTDPPPPVTQPAQDTPTPATAGAADPSVPAAAAVVAPAVGPKQDPAAGRTNASMSPGQEATAMPMPGQNNDHSAPLAPAQRASAP
jgi:hypothetical protein